MIPIQAQAVYSEFSHEQTQRAALVAVVAIQIADRHPSAIHEISFPDGFNADDRAQRLKGDDHPRVHDQEGEGCLLCIKLDGTSVDTLWLIPAKYLGTIASRTSKRLIVVPSAKATFQDPLTPYRIRIFSEVLAKIVASEHG